MSNSLHSNPEIQESLDWIGTAYDKTIQQRCTYVVHKHPYQFNNESDIAELARIVALQDSRPELLYDPPCTSRLPLPRRTFREWIQDLMR